MSESEIFKSALELSPEQRADYLDEACRGNQQLREEVELLLRAHDSEASFLKHDPSADRTTSFVGTVPERPGMIIGSYKLMEQIGEGGFGLVFVAEQQQPVRRKVALKIVKPGMDTREVVARFELERQALALMDHPNIARVFDGGVTDSGRPYFVMELVKGIPIIDYCDQQQLSARERLELFITVCQAAQHAHAKGIIHRDIKPSNVLVAPHDGVPVVKVIDFGVAKAIGQQLTDKTIYTRFTQMIGTPLYMSPEQAEINALDVDIRSDVYSLGVLLYELLTGTTPFDPQRLQRAAFDEIRRIIREEEPPKPSTRLSTMGESLSKVSHQRRLEPAMLAALVKGDLDWIVMKCLEKERTRRYETAIGLARDVQRFLGDEPIEARPPSMGYRARKFFRRHRGPVLTAAALLALLCLGFAGTVAGLFQAREASKRAAKSEAAALHDRNLEAKAREAEEQARKEAQRERDDAQRTRDQLRYALYRTDMNLLQSAWEANDISRVLQILDAHRPESGEPDLRGFEWFYWDHICNSELRQMQLDFGPRSAKARGDFVAFSASGNRCAAVVSSDAEKADAFLVKVWETSEGRQLLSFPLAGVESASVALSGNGVRLAVGLSPAGRQSQNRRIVVWDVDAGKELVAITTPSITTQRDRMNQGVVPMLNKDGHRLAAFLPANLADNSMAQLPSIMVWDVAEDKADELCTIAGLRMGSALSPDGSRLAALSMTTDEEQGTGLHWELRLHDALTGEVLVRTPWPTLPGLQASVAPNHADRSMLLYSPAGERLSVIHRHVDMSTGSPSAQGVIFDRDGTIQAIFNPNFRVAYQAFRPDGKQLATWFGDRDPVGTVWDTSTGRALHDFKGQATPVVAASFIENGTKLAASDLHGLVRVWNVEQTDVRRTSRQLDVVTEWALDGTRQAVFSRRVIEGISVRDEVGKEINCFREHKAPIGTVQFSPDGNRVVSIDQAGAVKLWNTASGQVEIELQWSGEQRWRMSPTFSEDGRRVAMPLPDGRIKVWELVPKPREVLASDLRPLSISLSADGRRLAMSCSPDQSVDRQEREVFVWDVDASTKKSVRKGHVQQVLLSPDGKYLVIQFTSGSQQTRFANLNSSVNFEVLNADTGAEGVRLKGEAGSVAMAFSPDSKSLATIALQTPSELGAIDVWDVAAGELRLRLPGHSTTPIRLAFSPDGRRFASTAQPTSAPHGELKLWELTSGGELLGLETAGLLTSKHLFAFSSDGNRILAMTNTGVEVWQQQWDASPHVNRIQH